MKRGRKLNKKGDEKEKEDVKGNRRFFKRT
jgi:hypothetical protein